MTRRHLDLDVLLVQPEFLGELALEGLAVALDLLDLRQLLRTAGLGAMVNSKVLGGCAADNVPALRRW